MKLEHLVYHGKREEGTLTVGRVDILSPFRKIKYYKGLRLEIGKQIPLDIAQIIAKDYPTVFKIDAQNLDDQEGYIYHISDILEECLARLGDEQALKVMEKLVEMHFDGYSIQNDRGDTSKKEQKPKRRRKS